MEFYSMYFILWGYNNMWLAILMETLEEPYGTLEIAGWFPSVRNAEDFISENRKNMRKNDTFNYIVLERYKCNYPTKLIEHVFPHYTCMHHCFRWDDEKNTFVRDKRLDKKIPDNYWISFRRNYSDHVEYRAEELKK